MVDPRVGRGFYPTYHADWPMLRWPLDHLFAYAHWTLVDFSRLDHVGSDHFPVRAILCLAPDDAGEHRVPEPAPGDPRRVDRQIRDGFDATE